MTEMDTIKSYKDLQVWQKSIELADCIYTATEEFPKREWYGLANQMRRAAVSISSNIAEGSARGTKEFAQFLSIARGSLAELETQLIIAYGRGYIIKTIYDTLLQLTAEISRMLMGLFRSITQKALHKAQSTKHKALA